MRDQVGHQDSVRREHLVRVVDQGTRGGAGALREGLSVPADVLHRGHAHAQGRRPDHGERTPLFSEEHKGPKVVHRLDQREPQQPQRPEPRGQVVAPKQEQRPQLGAPRLEQRKPIQQIQQNKQDRDHHTLSDSRGPGRINHQQVVLTQKQLPSGRETLRVTGLPPTFRKPEVLKTFAPMGTIKNVVWSGEASAFLLTFDKPEAAVKARRQLNKSIIKDSMISVEFC